MLIFRLIHYIFVPINSLRWKSGGEDQVLFIDDPLELIKAVREKVTSPAPKK